MTNKPDPQSGADDGDAPFGQIGAHPLGVAAVVAATVPFLIHVSMTRSTAVNGVAELTFFDPVAAIGGLLAVLLGFLGLLRAMKGDFRARLPISLAMAGAAVAVGLYHAARGFGLIGVPGA